MRDLSAAPLVEEISAEGVDGVGSFRRSDGWGPTPADVIGDGLIHRTQALGVILVPAPRPMTSCILQVLPVGSCKS